MEEQSIKKAILEKALTDIPFDGWNVKTFEDATIKAGFTPTAFHNNFPKGIPDTLSYFSQWADQEMLELLEKTTILPMRTRDKIALAVKTRIEVLATYKECVKQSAKLLALPQNTITATKITWRTADAIWNWGGDESIDYNRYTKRGLLSGVISTTMLYWLNDHSENHQKTEDFLRKRIDNVLLVGQTSSKIIKPVASFIQNIIVRKTNI